MKTPQSKQLAHTQTALLAGSLLIAMGALLSYLYTIDHVTNGSKGVAASDLYLSKRSKSKAHHTETKCAIFPVALFVR